MNSTKFDIFPPPAILKNDVECIRVFEYAGDEGLAIKVAPNAVPNIVFQHDNGSPAIENITYAGNKIAVPTLFVCGAGTQPSVMNFSQGSYVTIQVILKPHALNSLFGMNASGLTNCYAELSEFAAPDLNAQLIDSTTNAQCLDLLISFLAAKLNQSNARDSLIEESLRLIHGDITCISVKYLLDCLSISERQFERRFIQTVGVSPQSYIRVKRFNEAVRLIKTGHYARLTDIAHALNYYDQSHFIRDVIAFSGITPKHLSQKDDDSYHPQAGYSYV